MKTDRPFYQPGETIKAELQVNYFFGKAVAGGKVHVKCSKFDVGYFDFQVLDGQTDAEGHFSFEVKLPASFVGQPLEAGKASAKLEIAVTDTADHKETITKNVAVTAAPILVTAVPESGELVPGLENRIYVVTTYADSTPARCQVSWLSVPGPTLQKIQTDEAGFGQFIYRPDQAGNIPVTLFAQDEKGQEGRASLFLNTAAKTGDDTILLRTDRSLYRVGQRAKLVILTTRKAGTVYLDFIKDRQTYLTRSVEVNDGRAADTVTFDPTLAGTVQINAYLIGENGEMMRDRRLVIVDPADDLKVSIRNDAETYLPGGEAQVSFRVTNASGRGVVSALGVMVVDEAVFALQEMQPGLEKIYFYLEKEIATPRYEVHGWSLDQSMEPGEASPESAARRDTAARVLLASAKGVGDYTLRVDTYKRDNKAAAFQAKMAALLAGRWQTVAQAVRQFGQKHHGDAQRIEPKDLTIQRLVKEGLLKQADALDPWGTPMKIVGGAWSPPWQTFWSFSIASAGIDGQWSTADDITYAPPVMVEMEIFADVLDAGGAGRWMAEGKGEMPAEKFAGNMLAAPAAKDAAPGVLCLTGANTYSGGNTISGGALEPVRVREYFPETLYFNPAVITDHQGNALLRVPLADSITTWRLTCMASSARGRLGSATAGINVFQDFFVDIDFPVALTQHDEVSVPVAVYNYLKTDQAVRLEVTPGDWFELRPPAVQTLTLGPGEVRAVHFPIVARKIGFQKFTVTARGAHKSDAVARSVEVVPDGKEFLVSQSGRLEGKIAHTIDIPPEAIQGASKIFVKVYPGMMSQVVEGLDKMLRMPGGCFEQTSELDLSERAGAGLHEDQRQDHARVADEGRGLYQRRLPAAGVLRGSRRRFRVVRPGAGPFDPDGLRADGVLRHEQGPRGGPRRNRPHAAVAGPLAAVRRLVPALHGRDRRRGHQQDAGQHLAQHGLYRLGPGEHGIQGARAAQGSRLPSRPSRRDERQLHPGPGGQCLGHGGPPGRRDRPRARPAAGQPAPKRTAWPSGASSRTRPPSAAAPPATSR